jgi:peptide-methionine (S)-S-oxide reductase
MNITYGLALLLMNLILQACQPNQKSMTANKEQTITISNDASAQRDTATFAAGCFWCVEAVFQRLDGVDTVQSGYTGGSVKNPSYKEVCNGTTGHAEACRIIYDPTKISFLQLLQVFFTTHDPTQLNRQGNDVGTQYRSAVFYHNEEQKQQALQVINQLNEQKVYDKPIVTEVVAATTFYIAENYHQNYYNQNGDQMYCRFVIQPKLEKFEKVFKELMKKEYKR